MYHNFKPEIMLRYYIRVQYAPNYLWIDYQVYKYILHFDIKSIHWNFFSAIIS